VNSLAFEGVVKVILVLVLVSAVVIISRRDILSLFRSYAAQSLLLALVAFLSFIQDGQLVLLYTSVLILVVKGVFIPFILKRAQRGMSIDRDIDFHYLQPSGSILVSVLVIVGVYAAVADKLKVVSGGSLFLLGAVLGISLTLMGMMVIFSRRQVISKIVGYLVMENGVVLFSLFVSELPFLIEVLVLMDLVILVVISAILAFGMSSSLEEFHKSLNPFHDWFRGGNA